MLSNDRSVLEYILLFKSDKTLTKYRACSGICATYGTLESERVKTQLQTCLTTR